MDVQICVYICVGAWTTTYKQKCFRCNPARSALDGMRTIKLNFDLTEIFTRCVVCKISCIHSENKKNCIFCQKVNFEIYLLFIWIHDSHALFNWISTETLKLLLPTCSYICPFEVHSRDKKNSYGPLLRAANVSKMKYKVVESSLYYCKNNAWAYTYERIYWENSVVFVLNYQLVHNDFWNTYQKIYKTFANPSWNVAWFCTQRLYQGPWIVTCVCVNV